MFSMIKDTVVFEYPFLKRPTATEDLKLMYWLQILRNYSVYLYIHLPLEDIKISLDHVASEKTYSDSN